jgi:hypothetical protein
MKRVSQPIALLVSLLGIALCVSAARADDFLTLAFDNATVWPSGPRPGDNGKNFFNTEGINNGQFASFGVADFDTSTLGIDFTVATVTTVTVTLTQDNAAFTTDGSINFYITEDTSTSIQPADDAVFFDTTDPEGLNGQLQPVHFLGSGNFTQGPSGTVDVFAYGLDDATAAYVTNVLNNQGTLRVVITPADPDVSATYAGFSDPNYPLQGPMITVSVISAN